MADDNVSFTDQGTAVGDEKKKGGSSAMLDMLGQLEKKETKKKGKKNKKSKKKAKKGKTKKVRKADKYESQNFLFRVEGAMFCAGIIVAMIMLFVIIIYGIITSSQTGGQFNRYMAPLF